MLSLQLYAVIFVSYLIANVEHQPPAEDKSQNLSALHADRLDAFVTSSSFLISVFVLQSFVVILLNIHKEDSHEYIAR